MEPDNQSPGMLIARLDRIPVWSLPGLFIGIIGVGFLFTFYDIFDINVSFIQTCTQIVPHCTPPSAANYIGLPVLLNLVGYVIGTLALSPLADRAGRRDLLLVTMVISGCLWRAARTQGLASDCSDHNADRWRDRSGGGRRRVGKRDRLHHRLLRFQSLDSNRLQLVHRTLSDSRPYDGLRARGWDRPPRWWSRTAAHCPADPRARGPRLDAVDL